MKNKLKIGITIGDVNGIGIEVLGKYLDSKDYKKLAKYCELIIFGNAKIILDYFSKIPNGSKYSKIFENLVSSGQIHLVEIKGNVLIQFGKVSKPSGKFALESIKTAMRFIQKELIDCLVTLPICKESIQSILPNFIGHTEFIAQYFPNDDPLMCFIYKKLKLCLLTTHQPLKLVPDIISKDTILKKTKTFEKVLKEDFKIRKPRIAILGLNPHSGEGGSIGTEEITHFVPALKSLKEIGIQIEGPFPSDGFFAFGIYKKYDGIIACYHDQGLIPFKLISKGKGVNYTGGLPIVRTSPDHGTGFDIAGKNLADYISFKNAVELACQITINRRKTNKIKVSA